MKQKLSILCIVVMTVILSSCSKTDTKTTPNNLKVDGQSVNLNYATIYQYTTSDSYEAFDISLQSSETNPASYVQFTIFSSSLNALALGTYTYTYLDYASNKFSNLYYVKDVTYSNGSIVSNSGTQFSETGDNVLDGTKIVVSKNADGNFQFDITLSVKDADNNTIVVTGYFTGVLNSLNLDKSRVIRLKK